MMLLGVANIKSLCARINMMAKATPNFRSLMVALLLLAVFDSATALRDQSASRELLTAQEAAVDPDPDHERDECYQDEIQAHQGCDISRDSYCLPQLAVYANSSAEYSAAFTEILDIGVSYAPLRIADLCFWLNETRKGSDYKGSVGFDIKRGNIFKVEGLAVGVIVNGLTNIDAIGGTFSASLRLYFFNVTQGPFKTVDDAINTMYKNTTNTVAQQCKGEGVHIGNYFGLTTSDRPYDWTRFMTERDCETAWPSGECDASVMSAMSRIDAGSFNTDNIVRFPSANKNKVTLTKVADDDGKLLHIDTSPIEFKFKSLNRKFFPFQIDLIDLDLEMFESILIQEKQKSTMYMMCMQPNFSGFSNDVLGGQQYQSLRFVPYLAIDAIEPWYLNDASPFYFDETRQMSAMGIGSHYSRLLGFRIIVQHPVTQGIFTVSPVIFVSLASVAQFLALDPLHIGGSQMVAAFVGMNSLVTQNTYIINSSLSIMGKCVALAYGITGTWIFAVVLMTMISSAKKKNSNRWFVTYQVMIYRYLRMLAGSLCFMYVPLLFGRSGNPQNGKQVTLYWLWGLSIGLVVSCFIGRAVFDFLQIKNEWKNHHDESLKAFVLRCKPLELWSSEEVLLWIRIGKMHHGSYFSAATRSSIAEKLNAAAVDGKLLSVCTEEKLVQLVGLPWGHAVKINEELIMMSKNHVALKNASDTESIFKEP